MKWEPLETFWAEHGSTVLRRWKRREYPAWQYSLITCWKGSDDYFPGCDFLLIDNGDDAGGLESMEYWSK